MHYCINILMNFSQKILIVTACCITDFPGVVVCLAPLSLQGLFSLSRPARLVQDMILPVHYFTLTHRNMSDRNTLTVHSRLGAAYQRVP